MEERAYGTLGSVGSAQRLSADQPIGRPLETLAAAVQRINTATVNVQSFIDRFHGQEPETAESADPGKFEAQPPYTITIDRLFAALQRLENRVEALSRIG